MPIDLSNLSAEAIAAATTAVEAARRAREEREHQEVEERRKHRRRSRLVQEAMMRREAEERKEGRGKWRQSGGISCLDRRWHGRQWWWKKSGNHSQWGFQASNSPSRHLPVSRG
jgi:hypothetical protein